MYLLADVTRLEVYDLVRKDEFGQDMKLFLFTADERQEVRDRAKEVGVDVVVLKSPDAAEIINIVRGEVTAGTQEEK